MLHLVAGAVEGLSPRSVRITDQSGKLLSAGMSDESASGNMDDNYAYKRRYEKELAAGIIGQLEEVVGQNRVKVNVSAHMRFDHQTIKEELIDPDQTSVVSEQTVDESSTGSRSIPVGPARSRPPISRKQPDQTAGFKGRDKGNRRINSIPQIFD